MLRFVLAAFMAVFLCTASIACQSFPDFRKSLIKAGVELVDVPDGQVQELGDLALSKAGLPPMTIDAAIITKRDEDAYVISFAFAGCLEAIVLVAKREVVTAAGAL